MKLPLSWLKEFVPKLPPVTELADLLMMHGLEVEEVIDQGASFDHVVVGEITGVRPHPNADKLRLADVIIEPKGESLEIVCGAPNIEVGQKVPVALLGAKLPNGMTIEKRAIRGIESNGPAGHGCRSRMRAHSSSTRAVSQDRCSAASTHSQRPASTPS